MHHTFRQFESRHRGIVRSGFTLLELMLVLSILVAMGAIMTPMLGVLFERQKLKGAATEIRLRFEQARLEAMRTGQTQVFECVPETASFTFKPLVLQSETSNAGVGATVLSGGTMVEVQENGFLSSADPDMGEAEELEGEIKFVSCVVAPDMRAYSVAQDSTTSGVVGVNDLSTSTVGQRVLFYADGSTSSAEVQLKSPRGDIRAVQIRGLTGHSKVIKVSNVAADEAE